jgi:hypothetical protein
MEFDWDVSVFVTWTKPGHGVICKPIMELFGHVQNGLGDF